MPVVKELMKLICEKYKKDGKSYTEEFRFGKTKIFFKVGVLAEIEEIRENRVTEIVGGFIRVQKPSHKESLLNKNSMNILPLLSFKTPFTLGTNSEIGFGSDCSKRSNQYSKGEESTKNRSQGQRN
ncbi:hypothetical protein EIN_074900 [Entamoeba invadens IP1]|uniref:Uncharacterized protein n=1 Tax=Entamoeba invadens IP1 TaxID=370355 RepID=A0A0A1TYW1_ENTIV|nr:hypothetical protein EIN_074900 [Entamoeba invadens IP1]ELP84771.1 hypothetical protein EIN_074900 [Entamoeba invadens IP1]|eukprot:XP_004184117.1 hypothetical protein EIN_074900 [Entamoeba invadens IP1]